VLQVKEHALNLFFFRYFVIGPTFGSIEKFMGASPFPQKDFLHGDRNVLLGKKKFLLEGKVIP
jgi:hypothetical protein